MSYIRILHLDNYDPEERRFNQFAFNFNVKGISVLNEQCIRDKNSETCQHIDDNFGGMNKTVVSHPIMFWPISDPKVINNLTFSSKINPTNCHQTITHVNDVHGIDNTDDFNDLAWELFKHAQANNPPLDHFQICENSHYRDLIIDDLEKQLQEDQS